MNLWHRLRETWQLARESLLLDRQRSLTAPASDTAFLPAAMEIMDAPPSPAARILLLAMCGLVGLALIWATFGRVDIVVVAPGKLIPEDRVKTVQWGGAGEGAQGMAGVVREIHVREGEQVRAGQLLIELDPTVIDAEEAQATRALLSSDLEQARAEAIERYLNGGRLAFIAPSGSPADAVATQRSLLASTIAEYEARRASLQQQRKAATADLGGAEQELAKLRETLPLLEQQEAARRQLAEKGFGSRLLLLEVQQQLINHRRNIAIQANAVSKADAAVANLETLTTELRQELRKGSFAGLAQAEGDSALRRQEISKAAQRKVQSRLIAPVSGTIIQMSTHTVGGVVQPAEPLVTIVPADSRLVVEAQVNTKDIGFLRTGQEVSVKLETFPFTSYGLIMGRLTELSADVVEASLAANASGRQSTSPVYTARVALDPASVRDLLAKAGCDTGASCIQRLLPGMAAQVEIKTGRRSIVSYLLSPLARTADEAGRER